MVQRSVRPEGPHDGEAIGRLHDAAFKGPVEARIVAELRGTDAWIEGGSLVAVNEAGRVVGHLLLSNGELMRPDGTSGTIWMVGPVAVLPAMQRRGIGSQLMRAAIELAISRKQPVLCLLGHAGYYPRFGFEPARSIGIYPPHPWADENWHALRLPAWTPAVRGTARFAPAFPSE
jgi:putative acetyltransferase